MEINSSRPLLQSHEPPAFATSALPAVAEADEVKTEADETDTTEINQFPDVAA